MISIAIEMWFNDSLNFESHSNVLLIVGANGLTCCELDNLGGWGGGGGDPEPPSLLSTKVPSSL